MKGGRSEGENNIFETRGRLPHTCFILSDIKSNTGSHFSFMVLTPGLIECTCREKEKVADK